MRGALQEWAVRRDGGASTLESLTRRVTDRAVRAPDSGIALRPHVGLSLTFDHRALDGAPAGDLLTAICEEIEAIRA